MRSPATFSESPSNLNMTELTLDSLDALAQMFWDASETVGLGLTTSYLNSCIRNRYLEMEEHLCGFTDICVNELSNRS
jgi:hypothetical protein